MEQKRAHTCRPARSLQFIPLMFILLSAATRGGWGQAPEKITSASKHQEPLHESPIPVTVITERMIMDIGAKNLKDVLVAYVPGMTFSQDHNEVNVAMRGVYASSQQKILVLVNGHALNSRSYAAADLDFSISLDKVKRIEVLRGPASSLYGNGALTAVVNLFTKTATDVNETMVSAGIGNYGQRKISGLYGAKTDKGSDLLAWGTVYHTDGETVDIPASQDYSRNPGNAHAILDGFSGPQSHDVGFNLKTGNLTLYAAHRYGKYIEPFTAGGPTGESYNYSDYQKDDGLGPGFGIGSFNLDLSHERTIPKSSTLLVRAYFDHTDHKGHLVTDPGQKAHSLVAWKEWDAGLIAEVNRTYSTGTRQGNWLAGVQVDAMRVYDSSISSGTGGGGIPGGPKGSLLALGAEQIYSGYFQVKHPLGDKWIANAGLRYDRKVRYEGDDISILSPRAALIYVPNEQSDVTLSYSESFVDAPYFYRFNTLPSYRGGRNLRPEYLKSLQLSPAVKPLGNLEVRMNIFYNHLDHLVWRNNNARPTEPIYQNAGFLKMWGVEPEVSYAKEAFNFKGNVTYQRATDAQNYDVTGPKIHNVPAWTGNAILNINPTAAAKKDIWFNVSARFAGAQLSPINIAIGNTIFKEPDRSVDGNVVVNVGARVGNIGSKRWFLDARIYNLFDKEYEQGGSVPHPYPQPGRWFLLNIGCTF